MWREALPLGDGLTGALVSGGVGADHIWMNRFDRWKDDIEPLPDVADAFRRQRELVLGGRYREAKTVLSDALKQKGYRGNTGSPLKPVCFKIIYELETPFTAYRRELDMSQMRAFVSFTCDGAEDARNCFVSPEDDSLHYFARSGKPTNIRI